MTAVLVRERRRVTKTLWGSVVPDTIQSGRFGGFANVYGIVDDQDDLVRDGTFAKSARQKGTGLPIGWEHELSHPAGVSLALEERGRAALPIEVQRRWPEATGGLYVDGQLTLTPLNRYRVKAARQLGHTLGLSAQFFALQERPLHGRDGVAEIFEGSLDEISFTVDPANRGSFVTVMKSLSSRRRPPATPRDAEGDDVDVEPTTAATIRDTDPAIVARRLAYAEALVRTPLL